MISVTLRCKFNFPIVPYMATSERMTSLSAPTELTIFLSFVYNKLLLRYVKFMISVAKVFAGLEAAR